MVFFLSPDPKVVSDGFLEALFARGWEAYSSEEPFAESRARVEPLIEAFPQSFLIFSLGDQADQEEWGRFLRGLHQRLGERVRLGVIGRQIRPDSFTEGVSCLRLEGGVRTAQNQLLRFLAQGRIESDRRYLRMRCPPGSSVLFPSVESVGRAVLVDLSVNHLSLRFDGPVPGWEPGAVLHGLRLVLPGRHLIVDAVVEAQRDEVWVLRFPLPGAPDDGTAAVLVNRLVYRHHRGLVGEILGETIRRRMFFRT